MDTPRHLLSVWNPSYAEDAMDQHLRVFLEWAEHWRRGECGPEDVYVWWAKLRSPRREDPIPHGKEVLALQEQIDAGTETHLYLTDYRSLYVGHLLSVAGEDLLSEWPDEADHMPEYYRGREADFWFGLCDLRRLVGNDTPAVIEETRRLRNVRYHDHPVSLYGGMVELPLLVRREDDARWFDDVELLTEGRKWAERQVSSDTQFYAVGGHPLLRTRSS